MIQLVNKLVRLLVYQVLSFWRFYNSTLRFGLISDRAFSCYHRQSMFLMTRYHDLKIWPNSHFDWLIGYSEYLHYSRFLPAEQHYSYNLNFFHYLFLSFFGGSSWVVLNVNVFCPSLTLPFGAPPCNGALNCRLIFPLSSNHILILSFYLKAL